MHLVVVGASLAGLRAAQAARAAGFEGELTVVGDEPHLPYTRPPLSKELMKDLQTAEQCALPHGKLTGVNWRLGDSKDRRGSSQKNRYAMIGAEEMAWGDISVLLSLPGPGLGGPPVQFTGTPDQEQRFFSVFQKPGLHWGA